MNLFSRLSRSINPKIEHYEELTSRRQRETFSHLEKAYGIKLKRVSRSCGEIVLLCDRGISVDYNGLVSWGDHGFYPIEWSPFN